jgi:DNA-binding HxlR family transcriptional regulator
VPDFVATDWDTVNCSVARTVQVVGDRWTLLVLREAFQGVRRFDEVRVRTGIPRQVLSDRLRRLVDQGVLRREPYREAGRRVRQQYRLTRKGMDLYAVLVALMAWGDAYAADPAGPALELTHDGCGNGVHLDLCCDAGHRGLSARDVRPEPGPSARRRTA